MCHVPSLLHAGTVLLLSLPGLAWAVWSVTLAWEAPIAFVDGTPAPPDVIGGYTLYLGTQPDVSPVVTDVGRTTQVTVGELADGTPYYARVAAYTQARVEGLPSTELLLAPPVVLPPPPAPAPDDTAPPTVRLTAPPADGTVPRRATVLITAEASDTVGVTQVAVLVDGAVLCTRTTPPYACPWRVPAANKRTYQVQARASDAGGNVGVSAVHTVTAR